jgi:hypothetical protein
LKKKLNKHTAKRNIQQINNQKHYVYSKRGEKNYVADRIFIKKCVVTNHHHRAAAA